VIGAGLRRARFGGADGTTCLPCEVMLIKSRTDNELRRMGRSCTSATNGESRSQRRRHAFDKFEAKLETLKGRYSYGVIVEGDHRASVALARMMISHPTWVIPEESLSSSPIEQYRDRKGPTLMRLRGRSDFNGMGRCIEYYRGQRELLLWRRCGEGWCGA